MIAKKIGACHPLLLPTEAPNEIGVIVKRDWLLITEHLDRHCDLGSRFRRPHDVPRRGIVFTDLRDCFVNSLELFIFDLNRDREIDFDSSSFHVFSK